MEVSACFALGVSFGRSAELVSALLLFPELTWALLVARGGAIPLGFVGLVGAGDGAGAGEASAFGGDDFFSGSYFATSLTGVRLSALVRIPEPFVRNGILLELGDFVGVLNALGVVFEKLGLFCLTGGVDFAC